MVYNCTQSTNGYNMKIFEIHAGGFNASGLAVVAAESIERAVEMANANTNKKYDLTYHPYFVKVLGVLTLRVTEHVMTQHEFGFPHLPSTGSGLTVRF